MKAATRKFFSKAVAIATLFCMTTQGTLAAYLDLTDVPLFIGASIPPQVMLAISKEQQLFKKAYNDYSDLDSPADGKLETTYKHAIDYYGYFDSYKCYVYNTGSKLFVPVVAKTRNGETDSNNNPTAAAIAANETAKYCAPGSGQWSGNFLNWISMARIDTVRKLLYGGMRSTDTAGVTILERAFFPTDAHAWAKYYPGRARVDASGNPVVQFNRFTQTNEPVYDNDINQLTPFTVPVTPPSSSRDNTVAVTCTVASGDTCTQVKATSIPSTDIRVPNPVSDFGKTFGTYNIGFESPFPDASNPVSAGDQILFEDRDNPSRYFTGVVVGFPEVLAGGRLMAAVSVRVDSGGTSGSGIMSRIRVSNLSHTGISFCNLTFPASGVYLSHTNQDPPLIRAAKGNFLLWNANQRYQCYWRNEASPGLAKVNRAAPAPGSNGNIGALSEILASAEYPSRPDHALGGDAAAPGDHVARVQVCKTGLFGTENCKQYPSGNYKPIGLLQQYGDVNLIQFGLMTGSYAKNISGGVLRKNIGTFSDEVNVNTDGTFKTPAQAPGSPRSTTSAATAAGIVNTLNYIRLWGYDYTTGQYTPADNCSFQLTNLVEGNCTSWGNPMSEIYFESLRYFAGNSPTPEYTYANNGSKDNQLGLPLPNWVDPLSKLNYCAPLNVVVFNSSVSTNDDDLRGTSAAAITSTSNVAQLTNAVGDAEMITGGSYFFGKLLGASATPKTDPNFELCTPKNIPGLGDVSGICPEGPTVAGSYLLSGLAHYARVNRIRSNIDIPSVDTKSLKVTTYGIQLATNVPQLVIAVPGSDTQKVIIQPIYRLVLPAGTGDCPAGGPECSGGGTLVDLKFIRQEVAGNVSRGKVYINWEDSEQGGDYDQDMLGTLEWELDATLKTIKITTNAIAESTFNKQGFGYTISGTTQDGPHFHSGIEGFTFGDAATGRDATGVLGCKNCQVLGAAGQSGPQSQTYTLGASTAKTLQDPLWYAAKYGAFVDSNGNGLPDLQSEWDSKLINGQTAGPRPDFPNGGDGTPDTYFLVTNPLGLVAALDRAFIAILSNASASSVATNSTSLQTGTTIYQARFNANDWSGQVLAFNVDTGGVIARDPVWDAGQIVNRQDPLDAASPPAKAAISLDSDVIKGSGRSLITYNRGQRSGVRFRWPANPASPGTGDISQELIDNLNLATNGTPPAPDGRGQARLEYLRGSQANEGTGVASFRSRPISRLGDIVNSSPNFISAPNAGYGDDSYTKFRQDNANRQAMIYVGGNDGMLHAFRAADGRELLAYFPSMVHKKLNKLTDKTYNSQHKFYVDGSPEIGDAFINVSGVSSWQTVLVGTMGNGAQGLFALNVTRPDEFTESNAPKIALWEFTDKDDPDIGFIFAQPTIRRMANGKFAAIVPGGYNHSKPEPGATPAEDEKACTDSPSRTPAGCTTSSTGSAYLFVIFLDGPGSDGVWDEGTDYIKIRAAVAEDNPNTPNGLTQPLAADIDADGFVDFVYAGDLFGNLWKFDLRLPPAAAPAPAVPNTSAPISQWALSENRVILFVATDPDTGKRQPITSKPEATLHPTAGFIVTFGTGKYLERLDPYPPSGPPPNPVVPYQVQSFYGIYDKNDVRPIAKAADDGFAPSPRQTVVASRSQLLPHVIATSSSNAAFRVVVQAPGKPDVPDWSRVFNPDDPLDPITPPLANDSPPKHMGWLLDFPDAKNTGERSVFRPILTAGRLIFSTLLPNTQACQFGGSSFFMVVDPVTGGRIDAPVLDTDANGLLNSKDVVSFGGKDYSASGIASNIGIAPTPTIIRAGNEAGGAGSGGGPGTPGQFFGTSGSLLAQSGVLLAYALSAGSSGGNASTVIGLSAAGGRVSWRELISD